MRTAVPLPVDRQLVVCAGTRLPASEPVFLIIVDRRPQESGPAIGSGVSSFALGPRG